MNLKNYLALLFGLLGFTQAFSQYTEMLNANRPGVSQGAFAVGRNVLQFETGFSYGKEEHVLRNSETTGMGIDYAIRYGFYREQLEISLIGEYQSLDVSYPRYNEKLANFSSNTLGIKYLIYDPYIDEYKEKKNLYSWRANRKFRLKELIPAISFYFGLNVDFPDNPLTQKDGGTVSPKFMLSTQNNWLGGFVFVTNFYADWGTTSLPTYGYILTLTHATHRYFSLFVENQGFSNDYYSDQFLRGGVAILIHPDFQIDISGATNFKDTPSKLYGRLGLAYRFDMHDTDEYIYDDVKDGQEKDQLEKVKKAERKARVKALRERIKKKKRGEE